MGPKSNDQAPYVRKEKKMKREMWDAGTGRLPVKMERYQSCEATSQGTARITNPAADTLLSDFSL